MRVKPIPVLLFVYKRRNALEQVLSGLRANGVPLLLVFSDGPKGLQDRNAVEDVRDAVRKIDWCKTEIVEREENLGLGVSVRAGVTEALSKYDRVIVFEDDVVATPGTYAYLCAALDRYADDDKVMSVAAWTPYELEKAHGNDAPFFSGRFFCWGWGTWRRAWNRMNCPALCTMWKCIASLRNPWRYGTDLPGQALREGRDHLWMVRFAMTHILHDGLCLMPPRSMVTNIGFESNATNTGNLQGTLGLQKGRPPSIPEIWPETTETPYMRHVCRKTFTNVPKLLNRYWWGGKVRRVVGRKIDQRSVRARSVRPPTET